MPKFNGEILHANSVRMRVVGSGNMQLTLFSMDEVNSSVLADIAMQATTAREAQVLADFKEQLMFLEFKTTEIDETFSFNKIVIFVRPIASGYPI